jgi:hypothetical protein
LRHLRYLYTKAAAQRGKQMVIAIQQAGNSAVASMNRRESLSWLMAEVFPEPQFPKDKRRCASSRLSV